VKLSRVHVIEHKEQTIWEGGFFRHHGYRLQNEYTDGTRSLLYRNEFFDRPGIDCVAILLFREAPSGREIGVLRAFRPCLYFRCDRPLPIPESRRMTVVEAVAGSLEPGDVGEAAIRRRAALEVHEETGFQVAPDEMISLGGGFFPSHGQSTEMIHLYAVDVTGRKPGRASGDGSVNETLNELIFIPHIEIPRMCREGRIQDPKIEIGSYRLHHVL